MSEKVYGLQQTCHSGCVGLFVDRKRGNGSGDEVAVAEELHGSKLVVGREAHLETQIADVVALEGLHVAGCIGEGTYECM